MKAKQEMEKWRKEFSELQTETEREAFKEKIYSSLSTKGEKELIEGLSALKEIAHEVRVDAEKITSERESFTIEVFPNSQKDKEMLETLLKRLNIPYKLSA